MANLDRKPRRQLLVNRQLQLRFIRPMLLLTCLLMLLVLGATWWALWYTLVSFGLEQDPIFVAIFRVVGWTVCLEFTLFLPLVLIVGLLVTHRVAGPLVRIKAALQQMSQGNYEVDLHLRQGDELQDVAEALNRLAESLRRRSSLK